MQRLDKILSSAGAGSRKDLRAAIRAGRVRVNGEVCRDESAKFDEQAAEITLDGEAVELLRPALILLNKPAGYLTAADDPRQRTVMELIPERYRRFGVMPVGRLDKDTEGLLLLTNDGQLAHRIISPQTRCLENLLLRARGAGGGRRCAGIRRRTTARGWTFMPASCAHSPWRGTKRRARAGGKVPSGAPDDGCAGASAFLSQARGRRRTLVGEPRARDRPGTGYGGNGAAHHKFL